MKKGYVKCKSAEIYYEVYGEGRPILFLHGNGEDMTYFKYQKEAFKDKYKLIFIDSRGHGKSSFGNEKLTLDLMADDILEVLKKINIKKVDLLGFSDGGNIALIIAFKSPEVLRTLILVGANLKPEDLLDSEIKEVKKEFKEEKDKYKKEILGLMLYEPNIDESRLKEIKVPVLIAAGENDLIKESCTKRIAYNIENSNLKILENADHFFIDKKYEEFNHIFLDFINKY